LTRTALLALIVVCAVALPQHANASHERLQAAATPVSPTPVPISGRVDTITHGMKLSLILSKRVYLQDMLTKVTVRLQNVSRHPVRMYRYACPNGSLFVEVRDGSYHFAPDCDVHVEWHVVAGWTNQPVATIDYVKP